MPIQLTPHSCHDCALARPLAEGWPLRGTATCAITPDIVLAMLPGAYQARHPKLEQALIMASEPHQRCPIWRALSTTTPPASTAPLERAQG
jgi:hypothetical protein